MRWVVVCMLLFCGLSACAKAKEPSTPLRLQVVIIGVPEFSLSKYNTASLKEAIIDRCKTVKEFFVRRFGDAANITMKCTKETTTREVLRRFFYTEFPYIAADTATFVFVISHAEVNPHTKGSFLEPDLQIVTSDTIGSPDSGHEFELSSISVATELLTWFERAPYGSTVLAFLDVCHAGAFLNPKVESSSARAQDLGLRLNVMASSLPKDESYNATFTKALIDIWEQESDRCLSDAGMDYEIRNRIQDSLTFPLEEFEGIPINVVRYRGTLCLGHLGLDDALLVFYAGTRLRDSNYKIYKQGEASVVQEGTLVDRSIEFVRLVPGLYDLVLKQRGAKDTTAVIDLLNKPAEVVFLRQPEGTQVVGEVLSNAASGAEKVGVTKERVAVLRKLAAAAYVASGDNESEARIRAQLRIMGDEDVRLEQARRLAFEGDPGTPNVLLGSRPPSRADVATGLDIMLAGDFSRAARVFDDVASLSNPTDREMVGKLAYFAFGAAGDANSARLVRQRHKLDVQVEGVKVEEGPTVIELETAALESSTSDAVSNFKSLSIANAALRAEEAIAEGRRPIPQYSAAWQSFIDWSIQSNDPVDCPALYVLKAAECLESGGRSCLMDRAVSLAKSGMCQAAVEATLTAQCHNYAASSAISAAGEDAVCSYLMSK